MHDLDQSMRNPTNPLVFMDISIDAHPLPQRLIIELFADVVPKTAHNFRALCTGEVSRDRKPLHYKGTAIHRIYEGIYAQGGDIWTELNGTGEESVYGGYFECENFELFHNEPGILSMASVAPNKNGSRNHVVFGKVIDGMGTLFKMSNMGSPSGRVSGLVEITDCGEIKNISESEEGEEVKEKNSLKRARLNNVMESGKEKKKMPVYHHPLLPHPTDQPMRNPTNPLVFLDISIDAHPLPQRLIIELFADVVPKTAHNFRALCTGEVSRDGKPLHYKGTAIHRIYEGIYAQGGDIWTELNGTGEESVYGRYFECENFELFHNEPGILSMAGVAPDKNGSRFLLSFKPFPWFDRNHVVFGKVIHGMGTLFKMSNMGSPSGRVSGLVEITDCGEIKNISESEEGEEVKEKNSLKRARPNNVMESGKGKKKETLKGAGSSNGGVEVSGAEKKSIKKNKRRKHPIKLKISFLALTRSRSKSKSKSNSPGGQKRSCVS